MQSVPSSLPGVCQILLPRFHDGRGWFAESWNAAKFAAAGLPSAFVQDNQSFSRQGVLRGLHYQVEQPQGKLIRVLEGRDPEHVLAALFKAVGAALGQACRRPQGGDVG